MAFRARVDRIRDPRRVPELLQGRGETTEPAARTGRAAVERARLPRLARPAGPDRAYLVTVVDDRARAVVLRSSSGAGRPPRRSICSLCVTTHTGGVALLVAPLAGPAGRQGNSVGAYVCSDLACSLYVRGLRETGTRIHESLTQEQRIDRLRDNLTGFLAKVAVGEAK
ncbi:hypothetical protein KCH_74530 [Kitasatospora cheerisanensis KCTC 2395]|uniref:Elongation factor G-binding protein C-terminal treble-clef zinc-finger domain-containing protein n=1 Tax=Kitasatospora cheerisanensis KCTC 2395 TaxID=1348663 RepID=A0A066YH53_9ACTN|nr:hypothetical protein KCH_74530 [Kitasatospora cheerisanensis KCTC 2395]